MLNERNDKTIDIFENEGQDGNFSTYVRSTAVDNLSYLYLIDNVPYRMVSVGHISVLNGAPIIFTTCILISTSDKAVNAMVSEMIDARRAE